VYVNSSGNVGAVPPWPPQIKNNETILGRPRRDRPYVAAFPLDHLNRIAGSPSNTQVRRMSVFVTAAFALVAASPMVTTVPPNNWR
jgi:hypothetical protein